MNQFRKTFKVYILNPDLKVICDLCGEDFTESDEQGGVLFRLTAACPHCASSITANAKKYKEDVYLEYPLPDEQFKDFVYRIRMKRRKEAIMK